MASITNYVKDHFFYEIAQAGESYFLENIFELGISEDRLTESITVEYSEIKYVTAGNRDDELIDIDIILTVFAEVKWLLSFGELAKRNKIRWLRVSCTGRVDDGIQDFKILSVSPYKKSKISLFAKPFSDNLVPFLWKDELDDIAEEILKSHYPEMLQKSMPINPYVLAQTLGLKVEYRKITEDCSIFGRIYFEDDIEEGISERTIVIERDLENVRPIGTVNNTIIHECLHWILHRYSVELEKGSSNIVATISTKEEASASDWMEWQVHNLAPKVMMPKEMTQRFVRNKFEELKNPTSPSPVFDAIQDLVKATSDFFGVTIVAAKKRLVEFGIEEARGAFNYVDSRYVPPHIWEKGSLGTEQTFSIGLQDLSQLLSKNESLRNRILEGGLIYIDSHICLNDAKYVTVGDDGLPAMTYYARTHMNECCLVFDKLNSNSHDEIALSFVNILNNAADLSITSTYRYPSSSDNMNIEEESTMLKQFGYDIREVLMHLPPDFGGALKYLRKWRKFSNETLAQESLLSTKYVSLLQNNHVKDPTVKTIVALCVALSLPHQIAFKLMDLSGNTLRTLSNDEEMLYEAFMMGTGSFTVEHCNMILAESNFSLLTTKETL
ncbi:hypothetical protein [Streptococcus constellatus]|uniref:hypothetical protein n=1 Tax=Streptococcus constellatus TaxID=76860 RepID=UPI00319E0AD0